MRIALVATLLIGGTACATRQIYYHAEGQGEDFSNCYGVIGKTMEISRNVFVSTSAVAEPDGRTTVEVVFDIPVDTKLKLMEKYVILDAKNSALKVPMNSSSAIVDYVFSGPDSEHTDSVVTGKYLVFASTDTLLESFILKFPRVEVNGEVTEVPTLHFSSKSTRSCGVELGPGP